MKLNKILKSKDKTIKLIFQLDNNIFIESVILFLKNKITLCISSQAGCKFKCTFCKTGELGFKRDLTKDEILKQYIKAKKIIKQEPTAIVFMGMGEPLDNYTNVVAAINELNKKYKFSQKKITVSTCGIPDKMMQLSKDTKTRLAISLNATNNATRNKLMPINRKHPIEKIITALKQIPNSRHRPIMIEYVLIQGINDKIEDINKIAELFKGMNILVNLIPYNKHDKCDYKSTDMHKIKEIKQKLMQKGIKTFIRENKGDDILAACGTLG